jgi:hypothetical protein
VGSGRKRETGTVRAGLSGEGVGRVQSHSWVNLQVTWARAFPPEPERWA